MPVQINLTYAASAMPTQAQQLDIQYACSQWESILGDNMTINVQVWAVNMTGTNLNAMCIPGIIQTSTRTLTRPQAKLTGDIQNPNDANIDLLVVVDTVTPWVLGIPPATVVVSAGQYSLATTIMHELCHGLGFVGLCNVTTNVPPTPSIGVYTDTNLIQIANGAAYVMNPSVVIPLHFFPQGLAVGINVITPFANLFRYSSPGQYLTKGVAVDDYIAFMTADDVVIESLNAPGGEYTVETGNIPFQPFTTCDHITEVGNLMYSTTAGQYHTTPDASARDILRLIGWQVS